MSHLHHVHEVVEILPVVDGELVVLINNPVMDDIPRDADAQHVVSGVADGLSDQEQAVFSRLQLAHRLRTRDLPVKPAGVKHSKEVCKNNLKYNSPVSAIVLCNIYHLICF